VDGVKAAVSTADIVEHSFFKIRKMVSTDNVHEFGNLFSSSSRYLI
jgi:hypothetical protein